MKEMIGTALLWYFRALAKLQLWKIHPTIVGITGSAGKTSTMHAVHAILRDTYTTKASFKANSESGIPLDILGLHIHNYSPFEWLTLAVRAPLQLLTNWKRYQIYIVEMGIDGPQPPKNMGYLLTILQPHVGVFLNARPMHSEAFDPVIPKPRSEKERRDLVTQAIAAEKGKIITSLQSEGAAVLNADDPNVIALKSKTAAKTLSFGTHGSATVQLTRTQQSLSGTRFTFRVNDSVETVSFPQYLLPTHVGYSLAAAIAVGLHFQISLKTACSNLERHFQLPPGRASLIPGLNDSLILDSSYNASAEPMQDFLKMAKKLAPKRTLALLGDIRELGKVAKFEHEQVARTAAKTCDEVVLVGPLMQEFALPVLQQAGIPTQWFPTAYQAADFLKQRLQPNDLLLVKGSQNTLLLEIAVEALMAHPEQAAELLCRRGSFWDQRRAALTPPAPPRG